MRVSPALLDLARTQPLQAIKMVNGFSFASWAGKPSSPGPGAWMQGGEIALKCRMQKLQTGVNLFEHDFRICDAYAGAMSAAARVKCKSRLILGALDQMTAPKQARDLEEALQSSSVTLDCGHSLMAERPDQLLLAIRQALSA
jgi:pimeloyl-ACP methyl ester carboxylesterase